MPILGGRSKVRAKIEIIDSFSGHADHSELLDYFGRMTGKKERVWLVHGEAESAQNLQAALTQIHSGLVEVAELGHTVEF